MSSNDCTIPWRQSTRAERVAAREKLQKTRDVLTAKKERAATLAATAQASAAYVPPANTNPLDVGTAPPPLPSLAWDPSYGPTWQNCAPPGWPPDFHVLTVAASSALFDVVDAALLPHASALGYSPAQANIMFDALRIVAGAESNARFNMPQNNFDVRPLRGAARQQLLTRADDAPQPRTSPRGVRIDSPDRPEGKTYVSAIGPFQILPKTLEHVLRTHKPGWVSTAEDREMGVFAWDARLQPADQVQWLMLEHLKNIAPFAAFTPNYYLAIALHLNNLQGSTGMKLLAAWSVANPAHDDLTKLRDLFNTADHAAPGNWAYIPNKTADSYAQYARQMRLVANTWNNRSSSADYQIAPTAAVTGPR
jgi:hypothetical protein